MRNKSLRAATHKSTPWSRGGTGLILALLLLLTAIGPVPGPALADARPPTTGTGPVLHVGDAGLVVQWTPPPVETRLMDDGHAAVTVPGYSRTGAAGMPLLPVSAHLVALPPGAVPRLHILRIHRTRQPLMAPLERVPWPEALPAELSVDPSTPLVEGPEVDLASRAHPPEAVVFEELGTVRGVRLARLAFYPAVPDDGELVVTREVRVAVSWDAWDVPPPPTTPAADRLVDQLRGLVLNPDHVQPEPRIAADPLSSPATDQDAASASAMATALIEVAEPGLYRVGYDDLATLGFDGVDPTNLRLFQGSDEVAYHWVGDSDGQFEPGEYLLFYAQPRFSRWTEVDVYRLEADTEPGLLMESRSADPTGLAGGVASVDHLFEENELYMPERLRRYRFPGRDGDRWAWKALTPAAQHTVELPFDLQAADLSQEAELTLWLNGFVFPSEDFRHQVRVTVNDQLLGDVEWDGPAAHEATLPIPTGLLQASGNTLRLHLLSNQGCWLDAFSVRYARSTAQTGTDLIFTGEGARRGYTIGLADTSGLRAYDVTNPLVPQRLTGVQVAGNLVQLGDPAGGGLRRYALAAASGIMSPRRVRAREDLWGLNPAGQPAGADMLIITHPDFAPALGPLVALRESQGLSVAVADVLGIYDAWGDGRLDPEAIRAFIKHAYEHWNPRPTYVLLVGDGSYDPRQYRPASPPTFLPPYLADVDPWAGEAAADNRYVSVDGDDSLPDMLIGRLPVQTPEEAQAVVSKTVAYEADPGLGQWNRNVVMTAGHADGAGDFPDLAESLVRQWVPSSYRVTRYYCYDRDAERDECSEVRAEEIQTGLRRSWNQGAFLIGFFGHAFWHQWSVPPYVHVDQLPLLTNGPRAPVVLGMTCFTSAFHRLEPTLDESMVTLAHGGAVATWGSTGLGLSVDHELLADGFFEAVFADGVRTVGEAEFAGKLRLAEKNPYWELVETFVVLGDPALVLNREGALEIFLPLVLRGG